jgi:predicted transposase YbfD/YdcC
MFISKQRPIVVPQWEHQKLAGTLALLWGNAAFERPPLPCESFLVGVGLHDRTYWTLTDSTVLRRVDPKGRWPELRCIGKVRAEQRLNGQTSLEERLFISSTDGSAQTFGQAVCWHWGVENSVHWVLDVVFSEDDSRMLIGKGPKNLVVLRRIALNIVRQDQNSKKSLKMRRFRASLDSAYLLQLLVSAFAFSDGANQLQP